MIEHKYPDGNQLTLRLRGALTEGKDGAPGSVLVSVYYCTQGVLQPAWLVRGYVVSHRVLDACNTRVVYDDLFATNEAEAWEVARKLFKLLAPIGQEFDTPNATHESPGGAS